MLAPVDTGPARAHIRDLLDHGCTRVAIARAARLNRKTLERIDDPGRLIAASTEQAILAVTLDDLYADGEHLDHGVLQRLLDGECVPLPYGRKAAYHNALHAQGWTVQRIGDATRTSYSHVKLNLLRHELTQCHADVAWWQNAYHAAARRERAWQDYCHGMETTLRRVLDIAEHAPAPLRTALRGAVITPTPPRKED